MSFVRRHALPALLTSSALVLASCGAGDGGGAPDGSATDGATGGLQVLASFYPLEYVAQEVGGDLVTVGSITPPGTEPHDVELSPRQLRTVGDADVVLYLSGFQPAVDDAVAAREPAHLLDASIVADLAPLSGDDGHDHDGDGDGDHAAEDHGEDEHADDEEEHADAADDEHADEVLDPHFWLDPTRLAAVGHEVAHVLGEADPEHADEFAERAEALEADLLALDQELATGLAACERRVVVTSHAAFGYLTDRYDLTQVGISGLDPDTEPSPARLREIGDVVAEHGVTTIFAETLLDPQLTETLAADLGIGTDVLDPVESLTGDAADYRGVMESNLRALRTALDCS